MNTYRYEIAKHADGYRVTEADGPSAKATGAYATREAAEAAIEAVAGKPLDFEYGESEGIEYWTVEFEAPIFDGWKADIDGGEGGDTIITADNADEAMQKALAWAAAGSWEPGNEYYVRLLDADGEEIRREYVTA